MRKGLLVMFMMLLFATISAQHIKFMNVPMGSDIDYFISQMKTKGFQVLFPYTNDSYVTVLNGKFVGEEKKVTVSFNSTKFVNRVSVEYVENNWGGLYKRYSNLKSMLTKKYGNPSKCVEKFKTATAPNEDKGKVNALKKGKCEYYSVFYTNGGTIKVEILYSNMMTMVDGNFVDKPTFVGLTYTDSTIEEREPIDDL